ncbi:MAG TPA: alpha/beta fold hydrolase, partial [Sporichthya sp.]|nr:alpha/beta fold hydrolase [Sporichthya sp.]
LEGDPGGRPVVLLHGIGRSLEDWDPQYELLRDGNRLIGIDLPGFGYSQRRPEPATLAALGKGVLATLDALGETRPVHLVGNSLGGAVSLQILGSAPQRVASVVLVNSGGFGREVTYLLRMLAIPGLGKLMLNRPTRVGNRHIERTLYATKSHATPQRVEHALRLGREPGAAEFMAELSLGLGTIRGAKEPWRRELLEAARQAERPILIVWGDRDRILPPKHYEVARATFPTAKSHLFPGTGHLPQIERPAEFATLVREFHASLV